MVVLALLGVLMGISIGAFRRAIPTSELARNALSGALRQAKLFAIAENAPSTVRLEPGGPDGWPLVRAIGRRTVAGWHLEGLELDGWPEGARGGGLEEEPRGVLGKAVRLLAEEPSWVDFGNAPAFDSPDGFALEFFARADEPRAQTLFTKGKGLSLRAEADGTLTAQVRVLARPAKSEEPRPAFHSVTSDVPVLVAGSYVKVAVTFDGVQLRLLADDTVVGELVLQASVPFLFDAGSSLQCGASDQPAALTLDEVKWGIFAGEAQELRDMEIGPHLRQVRFAPDGALDPRFHAAPAQLSLLRTGGDPAQKAVEVVVRVGMLGDVH